MTLPKFLVVGANKAGTTSLHAYLGQHPEVFMSKAKEPMFFTFMNKSIGSLRNRQARKQATNNIRDYKNLFNRVTDEKAIGECSTSSLCSEASPANIKSVIPNAKIVVILRNPVERAYSDYLYNFAHGLEANPDFFDVLSKHDCCNCDSHSNHYRYIGLGFYLQPIRRYIELFSNEQVDVCIYDDMVRDTNKFVSNILKFLEVDINFNPNTNYRKNVSRNLFENAPVPDFTDEAKAYLLEIFLEEIFELQEFLARDLSNWIMLK